jgi:FixJ family two-component response regulator
MNQSENLLPTVYIVDRDTAGYEQLKELLKGEQIEVKTFESYANFLHNEELDRPCCVLAATRIEDTCGKHLQDELNQRYCRMPIVFCSNDIDIEMALKVMENGAITVQRKTLEPEKLVSYLKSGIQTDLRQMQLDKIHHKVKKILKDLSDRQKLILESIVEGIPTKKIALQMGVSQRLVEKERSEILRHFRASATPDVTLMIGEFRVINEMRSECASSIQSTVMKEPKFARLKTFMQPAV